MIKVKATDRSMVLRKKIKELGRYAMPGEEFYIAESRYELLHGKNQYRAIFVNKVEEVKPIVDVVDKEPEVIIISPETVKEESSENEEHVVKKPKKTTKKKTTKKK